MTVFGHFLKTEHSEHLPPPRQSSLDRHPYRVFYDKVEFSLFNGLVRFWGPNPVRLKNEFHFETSEIFYLYLNTNSCKGKNYLITFVHFNPTHCLSVQRWFFAMGARTPVLSNWLNIEWWQNVNILSKYYTFVMYWQLLLVIWRIISFRKLSTSVTIDQLD